jgi:hypothetical protein
MQRLIDRLTGRHYRDCDLKRMDEKIESLRQQKHDLADRTQVIQYEAYMGRKRAQEDSNDQVSDANLPHRPPS